MNGQQHYEKAEGYMRSAATEQDFKVCNELQQAAQVHATLALVQATLVGMEKEDWGG